MKLIYYNLFKGISKIDMDKYNPEWKTIAVMSVLILFNLGSFLNFVIPNFENSWLGSFFENKLKWLIISGIVFYTLHVLYASKKKHIEIIKKYGDNHFYNSIYAKSITIFYVIFSFIALYYSFGTN